MPAASTEQAAGWIARRLDSLKEEEALMAFDRCFQGATEEVMSFFKT